MKHIKVISRARDVDTQIRTLLICAGDLRKLANRWRIKAEKLRIKADKRK